MVIIHTTMCKIDKQSDLYKAGNYIQCLAITYKRKESEKYYIHISIYILTSKFRRVKVGPW